MSDFSVLVKLTSANFDFGKCRSDGFDVIFKSADGETLLKFDRLRFDSVNEVAEFIVKIPTIGSSTDTEFYIYYGNASASDTQDKSNAYDSYYTAVLPLNDDDSDTSVVASKGSNGTKKPMQNQHKQMENLENAKILMVLMTILILLMPIMLKAIILLKHGLIVMMFQVWSNRVYFMGRVDMVVYVFIIVF